MNHPDAVHICAELPPTRPLPLPNDCVWHLHGSPPCTDISIAKHSPEHEIERALSLVWWFLNFALRSNATSWSMENVAVPSVMSVLREFRARNAQFRNQIDFEVFDFYHFGVPQHRRRVLAGTPSLIAKLRRVPRVHRCIQDVISSPRGTHIRALTTNSHCTKKDPTGRRVVIKVIKHGRDACCKPVTGPSYTVIACRELMWRTLGSSGGTKGLRVDESAALQCFPSDYAFPAIKRVAIRLVGNAVPPLVMKIILS